MNLFFWTSVFSASWTFSFTLSETSVIRPLLRVNTWSLSFGHYLLILTLVSTLLFKLWTCPLCCTQVHQKSCFLISYSFRVGQKIMWLLYSGVINDILILFRLRDLEDQFQGLQTSSCVTVPALKFKVRFNCHRLLPFSPACVLHMN